MKNFTRIIGIAALVAVIGFVFAACGGGGGDGRATPVSDFSYDLTEDGNGIVITGYTGEGGALVIPSTIEDMPVTEIGRYAFRGGITLQELNNRDAITSVVVPDSVTVIGAGAFSYIDELTKATLPDGLKIIPTQLFFSCPKLTSVNLPSSLETIEWSMAFTACTELSDLAIPDSLTSIKFETSDSFPNRAFNDDGKLPIKTRQRLQELGYKDDF